MAAVPAAVLAAAKIHRIHKLPALSMKLNQISENGKEGFARQVSRYLSGEGEKNEWVKVDLVCKEGNLRDLTSIDRAGSRNGAYTKGRVRVYVDICSAFAQGHGHTKAPFRTGSQPQISQPQIVELIRGLAYVKIDLEASATEIPEDKQSNLNRQVIYTKQISLTRIKHFLELYVDKTEQQNS